MEEETEEQKGSSISLQSSYKVADLIQSIESS